jgi:hypothetical protein
VRTQYVTLILLVGLLAVVVVLAVRALATWRAQSGGAEVAVRCKDGHVFTTDWIPGVSFRAVRLGNVRYQYCPVGRHWTFVTRV